MSTYSTFQGDSDLEQSGVILDFGKAGKVKIARAGGSNTRFQKRLMQLTKPVRRAIQTDTLDRKTADAIVVEAYVDTVVLSWEGITDRDGKQLPFSKENAMQLFTDLPDFFAAIKASADDGANFRAEVLEGDAKNS